jgi:hypothetical protein
MVEGYLQAYEAIAAAATLPRVVSVAADPAEALISISSMA